MDIVKQVYVAPSLHFFKEGFKKKYNLVDYHDVNEPAIFYGAAESSKLINKHKSYKIIFPCCPKDYPIINDFSKTLFICSEKYNLPKNVIRRNILPKIKDYVQFEPTVLGDKIYYYSGFKNGWNKKNKIIDEIQKKIDYEIITTNHNNINEYYDIEFMIENFYKKSFLNLNFTDGGSLTTVIEMGLMGRKTIFKNPNKNNIQMLEIPNFISYNSFEDILKIISEESKKIGTLQKSIDAHNIGDEWLNLNFWL